jgi:hypothetical protein
MIRKGIFLIGLIGLSVSSCIEHEIIPAPEPQVDLTCSFEATIDGGLVSYTENVDGYAGFPTVTTQSELGVTKAQYLFSMTSQEFVAYPQIGLGSLQWPTGSGVNIPALTLFNSFFTTNDSPLYSNGAINGFQFTFHDEYGLDWSSDENSLDFMDVAFTGIKQESDASGDYSKFICSFNCTLYHVYSVVDWANPPTIPATMLDSIATRTLENGVYQGYFRR